MMWRFAFVLMCWLGALGSARADLIMSDIQLWVGTGSNEAAFVVDFKNGTSTSSFAWGYRWDGAATGYDMLHAIAGSENAGLRATLQYFDGYGYSAAGFGFDTNRNGVFGVSPVFTAPDATFTNGLATLDTSSNPNKNRAATDPGDLYTESDGFPNYSSYWGYFTKQTGADSWAFSDVGMSNRNLVNGAWDGWSYVPNSNVFPPAAPDNPTAVAAVPEPGPLVLLSLTFGFGFVFYRMRRLKSQPAIQQV